MGSPGDKAVNGGEAIYELRPIYLAQRCFLGTENNPRKGAEGRHEHRPPICCMRAHCETDEWEVRVIQRSMAAKRFTS